MAPHVRAIFTRIRDNDRDHDDDDRHHHCHCLACAVVTPAVRTSRCTAAPLSVGIVARWKVLLVFIDFFLSFSLSLCERLARRRAVRRKRPGTENDCVEHKRDGTACGNTGQCATIATARLSVDGFSHDTPPRRESLTRGPYVSVCVCVCTRLPQITITMALAFYSEHSEVSF